jgi:methyl-accepting chemotaxis protein
MLSLKMKLLLFVGIFSIIIFLIVGATFYVINSQSADAEIIDISGRQRMLCQKMTKEALKTQSSTGDSLIKIREDLNNTAALFDKSMKALKDGGDTISPNGNNVILPKCSGQAGIQLQNIAIQWESFKGNIDIIKSNEIDVSSNKFTLALNEVWKNNIPLLKELNKEVTLLTEASQKKIATLKLIQIIALIIGLILSFGFGMLALMITKQMNNVINDLTEVTSGVSTGAQQINSASAQVSDSSQNIAESANNQAASLEETSASLVQMSAMVKQNSDNTKQAATVSENANKSAQKGKEVMTKMFGAIQKIKSSSHETSKIMKTIDEIAFQTNLLALNAAVEAARAGEAGKGFAVVAEEVRNLSKRSADAAKNTAELIEVSLRNSDYGVTVSEEVGGILNEIVDSIQKVVVLINEVSAATQEQSQGIEEINKAIAELDNVTQGNAANAEETASASEQLSAQAAELGDYVNKLDKAVHSTKELVHGASSANLHTFDSYSESPVTARKSDTRAKAVIPKKLIPYDR